MSVCEVVPITATVTVARDFEFSVAGGLDEQVGVGRGGENLVNPPQSAAVALRTPFPLLAGALLAGALLAKQRPVHRDVPSAPGRLGPQLPRDTQSGFLPPLFHYPAAVTLTLTSFGLANTD